MGMGIGINHSNRVRIDLKNPDGSYAGSISYTKSAARSGKAGLQRKKRLNYNSRAIATQLMMAKTPATASQVAGRARRQVVELLRRQALCRAGVSTSYDYDEDELDNALAHAKSLARIAKKRVRHLQQEESLKGNGTSFVSGEMEEAFEEMFPEDGMDLEGLMGLSEEEIRRMMEELEQAMQDLEEDAPAPESTDALSEVLSENMDSGDLERLKKKHRADELREIMEADMKYLKSLFDKLTREKQSAESSSCSNSADSSDSGYANAAVSLELAGMEMPVEAAAAPVTAEGANMDITV